MGRKKKPTVVVCRSENSVRECDVIMFLDPTHGDANTRPLPQILPAGTSLVKSCSKNYCWCRLNCVCDSVNAKNLDIYNRHCRDTGFAECLFGCVCGNLQEGQNLQTYKQLTFGVDKTKKIRWQDDDECGFVPPGTVLNLEDGRPKRKSQPPERFRHDIGDKDRGRAKRAKLAAANAKESKTAPPTTTTEKKAGRPRRVSGDQKPLLVRTRKRIARTCNSTVQNYAENNDNDNEMEEVPLPAQQKQTNGHVYVSSRKPDLPRKRVTVIKYKDAPPPGTRTREEPSSSQAVTPVVYGQPLSVIELEHHSGLIFMVVRVIDGKNKIQSFVEWNNNTTSIPTVSLLANFLHSKKIQGLNDCSTVMRLPFEDSEHIGWFFYDIPEDYVRRSYVMFPNLHAIVASGLLRQKIETHKPKEEGEILIIDISDINSNKHEKKELEGSVYLLLEYDGAVVMGTSPPFYRKPKSDVLYVPMEGSNNNNSATASSNGDSNENVNQTSSETGSESERSNSGMSDQTDDDDWDPNANIS